MAELSLKQLQQQINNIVGGSSSGSSKIGTIEIWTSTTIPDGYLECNGQAISRTSFSELYNIIGTLFGAGDGSTTFNLPDLRGEFVRGWDHAKGVDIGRVFGSSQADELKSHNHGISVDGSNGWNLGRVSGSDRGEQGIYYTSNTGGNETRPRNIALIYIIKAKNITGSDPSVQGSNADTLDGLHASAFALKTEATYDLGHLFADNGYQKFSNGLMMQWFSTTVGLTDGNMDSRINFTINFPISFPNKCLRISDSKMQISGQGTELVYVITQITNTQLSGYICRQYGNGYDEIQISFMAIGN